MFTQNTVEPIVNGSPTEIYYERALGRVIHKTILFMRGPYTMWLKNQYKTGHQQFHCK